MPVATMTGRSSSAAPPQLMFDDGSRIMETTTVAEMEQTCSSSAATTTTTSPRGAMTIESYYEVTRLSQRILETIDVDHRKNQDDGWLCRVALQFPDELLRDAAEVCWAIEETLLHHTLNPNHLEPLVFVLGDTTFGPCCPDEVSALHLEADVLVHYGHACLSPAMSLPVLYSFGMTDIDVGHCVDTVLEQTKKHGNRRFLLLYEVRYHHAIGDLQTQLRERGDVLVVAGRIPEPTETGTIRANVQPTCCGDDPERCSGADGQKGKEDQTANESEKESTTFVVGGLELSLDLDLTLYTVLFVGDPTSEKGGTGSRQYVNTMLRFLSAPSGPSSFWTYSPANRTVGTELPSHLNRQLNRRFYLTQKARDASVFGILVGTLSQLHFRRVVSSLRRIIEDKDRSCYTFAVGKINPAKLANFGEVDCYVLVACGENSLLDGERDLHVPVITPLELNIALGYVTWGSSAYSLDYNDFLMMHENGGEGASDHVEDEDDADAPYFSLVKGKYMDAKGRSSEDDLNLAALPGKGQITAYKSEASEFLKNREYKGLETKLGETAVQAAIPGQVGIASNYSEHNTNSL